MKKILTILIVSIALTIKTNAQIPNSGFENWKTHGNCIEAIGWNSTNLVDTLGSYFPVTRSTDHYPESIGSYSIRLANDTSLLKNPIPNSYLGWGFAWNINIYTEEPAPAFPISGHPNSFTGYYKCFPINVDTMTISLMLYKNRSSVASATLSSVSTVSEWTSFNVPISSYVDADSALILLACQYQGKNHPNGNSVLYVDNLNFDDLITSLPELNDKKVFFNLFPNPASDIVTLEINKTSNEKLISNIYSNTGVLVRTEILKQNQQQFNINDLSNGIYMVEIKSKGLIEKQKLIIQR